MAATIAVISYNTIELHFIINSKAKYGIHKHIERNF